MKACNTCLVYLPADKFHISRVEKDGHSGKCKACAIQASKAWYAANKERSVKARRDYYSRNKSKFKVRASLWAKKNPGRRKEITRKSAASPAGLARARKTQALRRSREVGAISQMWWDGMDAIIETRVCLYCQKIQKKLVMDHFIPVSRGGRTEIGNLLPCCRSCNAKKYNIPPEIWVKENCGEAMYNGIVNFLSICRAAYLEVET